MGRYVQVFEQNISRREGEIYKFGCKQQTLQDEFRTNLHESIYAMNEYSSLRLP